MSEGARAPAHCLEGSRPTRNTCDGLSDASYSTEPTLTNTVSVRSKEFDFGQQQQRVRGRAERYERDHNTVFTG